VFLEVAVCRLHVARSIGDGVLLAVARQSSVVDK
jgi:hypothetical protein